MAAATSLAYHSVWTINSKSSGSRPGTLSFPAFLSLRPIQQFPAIAGFLQLSIVDGIVVVVGPRTLPGDPATDLRCEPDSLIALRTSSKPITAAEVDEIGKSKHIELTGRHRH